MDKINIRSDSNNQVAKILSNLTTTPFSYGEYNFKSVESALQGIKFKDKEKRESVFKLDGMKALKEGRVLNESFKDKDERYVYWYGKRIKYNSKEHRLLIAMFIREKVRQSTKVQEALLQTTGKFVYHNVGQEDPKTSLPEKLFIEILLSERKILSKLESIK